MPIVPDTWIRDTAKARGIVVDLAPLEGEAACEAPHADRGGKSMKRRGITLPRA
ncbi:MAG: hypothetical protein ACE5H8_09145 [Alphaproteobacteria bacterium]